ncbi:MAG: hypothetical protein NT069_20150, partial [Planctomycetota bacterium]|nr:hypothetical protein [Planctomycetota bacterium]
GIRLLRTLPSIAAMSRADSLNPLISNVLRLLGIAGALVALKMGGGMEAIAAAGSAGELAALVGSILLLYRRHQVDSSPLWRTSGWYLAGVGFAGLWLVAGERFPVGRWLAAGAALFCLLWMVQQTWRLYRKPASPPPVAPNAPLPVES